MADAFLGEIRLFGGNFAPSGWAFCNGQLLAIRQHTTLYSLLGTTYGGDGMTTFCLPNLAGRVAVGQGNNYDVGEMDGAETGTVNTAEMPAHTHVPAAATTRANAQASPEGAVWALTPRTPYAASPASGVPMNPLTISPAGGSQPHDNMMPFLTLSYIICMDGIFPSRP